KRNKQENSKPNYLYLATILLSGITIFAIQSRAGIGATMVSSLVVTLISTYYFIESKEIRRQLLIILLSLIVVAVAVFSILYFFDFISDRWKSSFSAKGWFGRTVSWMAAYESIKAAPWFGHGLGSSYNLFFSFVPANARLFWSEHSYNHVHSEYLEYLQEAGLVGGMVFLIFWGYLFYQLFRILKYGENRVISKIAIGIFAGLLAYLMQCVFSVAPRMMVVKLPLFTLFGLVFVLRKTVLKATSHQISLDAQSRIVTNLLPVILTLNVCWMLYLPWMYGQYNFVKIQSSRPSIIKLQQLENLVKERADVYALNYLTHQQIAYGRWNNLRKTTELIDGILPYYRDLGHSKLLLAKMDRDYAKVIRAGKEFQNRDRYFIPSIHVMLEMAIRQNDNNLFFEQIILLTRSLIFKNSMEKVSEESSVKIGKGNTKVLLAFKEEKEELKITWNLKGFQNIVNITQMNYQNNGWKAKDRVVFYNSVAQLMIASPYLQIQIEPEFEKDRQDLVNNMSQFFLIRNEQMQKIKALDIANKKELSRLPGKQRNLKQKEQQEERKTIQKGYTDRLENIAALMREKTNWDEYVRRNRFTQEIIQHLVQVVFPPALKTKT
ncbi:MAG: hypothetical protein GY786_18885, partial [Proteobacteria bacterium]|nr:hypothetical protein [Pseudomonadota bacterium]